MFQSSNFSRFSIKSAWILLLLLGFVYSLSYFHRISPMILSLDIVESLNTDAIGLGLISSANLLGYSLGMIPTGLFVDWYGGKKVLIICQLGAGILGVLFACSPNIEIALFARFFMGTLLVFNIPALKILANWVPDNKFTTVSSALILFYIFGIFLAGTPLAYATLEFSWRGALGASSALTIFLGVFCIFFIEDYQNSGKYVSSIKNNEEQRRDRTALLSEVVQERKNVQLWLIILYVTIMVGNLNILSTMWWGVFLMQGWGLSKVDVGTIITYQAIVPIPCYIIYTYLAEKVLYSYRIILMFASFIAVVTFGVITFVPVEWSFMSLCVFGILYMIAFSMDPIYIGFFKKIVSMKYFGTLFGLMYALAHFYPTLGNSIFAYIYTYQTEVNGKIPSSAYADAFMLLFISSLLAFIVCFYLRKGIIFEK